MIVTVRGQSVFGVTVREQSVFGVTVRGQSVFGVTVSTEEGQNAECFLLKMAHLQ